MFHCFIVVSFKWIRLQNETNRCCRLVYEISCYSVRETFSKNVVIDAAIIIFVKTTLPIEQDIMLRTHAKTFPNAVDIIADILVVNISCALSRWEETSQNRPKCK